jgi:HSP20 family molecular chaperone IbpA
VPGFAAKDLEVEVGHRRAVICRIHSVSSQLADDGRRDKRIMRVVELPFEVDPALSAATLQSGELRVYFRAHGKQVFIRHRVTTTRKEALLKVNAEKS